MIAREVREDSYIELNPPDPALVEAVRRHLHRDRTHPLVGERAEDALELDRTRRREPAAPGHGRADTAMEHAKRADRRGGAAGRVEQVPKDADRGRLAIRACDRDERQL